MKSHDLAKRLLALPNHQIIMSSDEEGNGYGTIDVDDKHSSIEVMEGEENLKEYGANQPLIILYPWQERLELDEIPKEE